VSENTILVLHVFYLLRIAPVVISIFTHVLHLERDFIWTVINLQIAFNCIITVHILLYVLLVWLKLEHKNEISNSYALRISYSTFCLKY
jgi:hypothetical protein